MQKARTKKQKGYALLEYCAGAAIIATILWGALNTFGDNMSTLLGDVGSWATKRGAEVNSAVDVTAPGVNTK